METEQYNEYHVRVFNYNSDYSIGYVEVQLTW
jgi:hypothetical protein